MVSVAGRHSLIGLHVDGAAADDVEEQHGPLGGLLGAALHRVEHTTHLARRESSVKPSKCAQKKGYIFVLSHLYDSCSTLWTDT